MAESFPKIKKKRKGPFRILGCEEPPPHALIEGVGLINRGEFFEAHEVLENLWRSEVRDVRYLYQGLLLVGIGFYHLRRGNPTGARSTLARGLALLDHFRPVCQRVDVESFFGEARQILEEITETKKPGATPEPGRDWSRASYPKVAWVESPD